MKQYKNDTIANFANLKIVTSRLITGKLASVRALWMCTDAELATDFKLHFLDMMVSPYKDRYCISECVFWIVQLSF